MTLCTSMHSPPREDCPEKNLKTPSTEEHTTHHMVRLESVQEQVKLSLMKEVRIVVTFRGVD